MDDFMEIIKNPTTIKLLSQQIIIACVEYILLSLSEQKLKELLLYYATNHVNKLFKGPNLNPTALNRIGKKERSSLNTPYRVIKFDYKKETSLSLKRSNGVFLL